ncbi:protein SWEETIE-like isoform X1 [Vicia villosa]|uniref:protein SWEETIE-like isoform X1 n=3 Tax=Vicia villosa TaxID=3911 RepID=UPI00273AE63E|nr:protein SWEETIE-like isoform X1 [Vicia villosa]
MSKNQMAPAPLSRFGVLVAQLESIVSSFAHKSPEPLLCFDLLSDLISAIDEDTKDNIMVWQRRCEDALYSLLVIGAKRPVRHLASVAMAKIISKGDGISIYSRASGLQGFLSDGKKSEPLKIAGAAQCLGELYKHFGRKITSGLLETTNIAAKLMKFNEEFVRQEALYMLRNALEGSGGSAASTAYSEGFRLIMRSAAGDKSFAVRIASARCLKAFASIGGPGLGVAELDNSASYCVKALEDPVASVRDAFAETLGSLLALGMNPEAQIQPKGKGPLPQAKKLEGGLQKHLILAFTKASGVRSRHVRVGLTLSWVFFLQAIRIKYLHPDSELQNYALQVMEMLRAETSVDAHALACVLYVLRVGVTDQMTEPTQRDFLLFLGKQLQSPEAGPSMMVAALRTVSYTLKTLGEVPFDFKEVLDNTVVAAVSHSSKLVRIEAALALRAMAEVDPTCVSGLTSYGVTNLTALRESVSFEKGSNLQFELDSLHGQATVLAALVSISPKLPLGYPARLPRLVFEVSKKMLIEYSHNPSAATVEKEAGWLLLSSLLVSLPKEELEEDVFDILALWATLFTGNPENEVAKTDDLMSRIYVWSAAVHALTAFIKCFISPDVMNDGVLLQPVLVYLNSALSYISALKVKELPNVKPAVDTFIIKTLIAYQSVPDPASFKSDHPQIIQLCTFPFRHASECEESSCLRMLLDKRDAWLGPWIPGRDWFEDELRAFQGGKDSIMPCVWENEISSFPQPETISKTLVNQMLLFFGILFSSQDSGGMLSLLGVIEQCLKAGKKQHWRKSSITNICVGLLAGFKSLLSFRPQTLEQEILGLVQSIFQSILVEGDICASQRRASSEVLGYLARFGNDIFTARLTRSLLGELNGATDSYYAGSIALALGCIHHSAGGIALSTLVPATVSSITALAKSFIPNLQIWSMHGLLLTIEAAGLSFVSHVQATLSLAMDILLSDDNGLADVQQGVGRLINAIVAVLGPELVPGSIFFSRSKSAIAEISCWQETSTMLESARFTQQLVLFAPKAVSVHSHVQTLLSTLSSRQPTLRHLAISTLRHLIEKDPASVIVEQIEDNLFFMLDEETDSEIGNLVRTTIMRLLYASCPSCPSHWISVCRKVVLATSMRNTETNNNAESDFSDGDSRLNLNDEDNMVSGSNNTQNQFQTSTGAANREKYLRYRTRLFAAECLSHLPDAVGRNPAHFDLFLARKEHASGKSHGDWLVLHLQELISLAYQISTIQFENMQPVGVSLLGTIVDKFEKAADPELPEHLLLEQYQAQLVSAVRTTLDTSSSPSLLEAGLHLATKILTSGIISGDQVVVRRIFSLISRPLNDFEDIYYPSFAEWVTSKIKVRLLAAHASLKCYIYASMRKHQDGVPDEYSTLLPLFQKSSSVLGKYWIHTLKDYSYISLCLSPKRKWNLFLDGLQSPVVSSKLRPCLDESWPVILQALALDSVPVNSEGDDSTKASVKETDKHSAAKCQYSMVQLKFEDFKFLWGFSLLGLFQSQHPILYKPIIQLAFVNVKHGGNSPSDDVNPPGLKLYEIVLPMFQFLSTESFFGEGLLNMDICKELLQILSYSTYMDNSWNSLAISILSQVAKNCPEEIFNSENFTLITMELCIHYLLKLFHRTDTISVDHPTSGENVIHTLCSTTVAVIKRIENKMTQHPKSMVLAIVLVGYKCVKEASTEIYLSEAIDMVNCTIPLLKRISDDEAALDDSILPLREMFETCLSVIAALIKYGIEEFHLQEVKSLNQRKLIHAKLAFSLEQIILIAKLALESKYVDNCEASKSICVIAIRYCVRCFQTVLSDSNMQVQVIGLQFLKARIQRGVNTEDNSFLMFLAGELITDIFTLIHKMLKQNTLTKESVNIASECLSLMVVLQALAKGNDCQRSFMTLLLEAIVTIFLSTTDGFSPEIRDLRNTAIKLVSRLAQIPSSAMHFKDVLLSMPPLHRQELQGVIRASVTHDKNQTELKIPVLDIKMPKPVGVSEEKHPAPSAVVMKTDENNEEEDDDSEDDWDAFQSFPVSKNEGGDESNTEHSAKEKDPSIVDSSSDMEVSTADVEFHDQTGPGVNEPSDNENQKMEEESKSSILQEVPSSISGNELNSRDQKSDDNEQYNRGEEDAKEDGVDENESHDESPAEKEHPEIEEELQSSGLQEDALPIPGIELVSCDQKPEVEAEGSIKKDAPDQAVSDSSALQQGFFESDNNEQYNRCDEDAKKDNLNKNESHDSQHGMSKSPAESAHQEVEEELRSSELQKEVSPIPGNELVSCDQNPEVEAEGSIEDAPEQAVSDPPELQQGCDEDGEEDNVGENKSHDPKRGTSESPVESAHQKMNEELGSSELQEEVPSIPGNELDSCDQKPDVEAEEPTEEDVPEQVVSDSPERQQSVLESDNIEQRNRSDEDKKKDGANENENYDSKQGISESQGEIAYKEIEEKLVSSIAGNELDFCDQKPEVEAKESTKEDMH